MGDKDTIELLVEGGKASPGPTTAPKLGAYKLNIGEVFQKVNQATEAYKGMQVPVKLIIDKDTKEVSVEVGTPPVSSLIKKELGLEKAKTKAAEEAEKAAAAAEAARTAEVTAAKPEGEKAAKEGEPEKPEEIKEDPEKKEETKEGEEAKEGEEKKPEEGEEKPKTEEEEEELEDVKKGLHKQDIIGNLKMEQVVKIAKMKMGDLLAKDLKSAVKMVVGTAVSMMGIQIEGKWPKEVIKDINRGRWDSVIK
jgi:ribosomal protein L11